MLTIRRTAGILAIAAACSWSSQALARWGVALDLPLVYSFDNPSPNQQSGNTPADWVNPEGGSLDGFLLALYTPLNIAHVAYFGLGVDEYSVKNTLSIPNNGGGGGPVTASTRTDFEIYNLIVDFPTEVLNFGIGYGIGSASSAITLPGLCTQSIRKANVTQELASIGAVFGRFDVHLSYRWVDVDNVTIPPTLCGMTGNGNNPPNFFLGSGRLTTLGLRMNFGT